MWVRFSWHPADRLSCLCRKKNIDVTFERPGKFGPERRLANRKMFHAEPDSNDLGEIRNTANCSGPPGSEFDEIELTLARRPRGRRRNFGTARVDAKMGFPRFHGHFPSLARDISKLFSILYTIDR